MPDHPDVRTVLEAAGLLVEAAEAAARLAQNTYKAHTRRSRGKTLRPGAKTPLWNQLSAETRQLLNKRGEKVNLGRYLGLPRQRIHEFLMAKSAGPDAERTLLLLRWVQARRQGRTLS